MIIGSRQNLEVSVKKEDSYKVSDDKRKSLQTIESDVAKGRLISDEGLKNEEDKWLRDKRVVWALTARNQRREILQP